MKFTKTGKWSEGLGRHLSPGLQIGHVSRGKPENLKTAWKCVPCLWNPPSSKLFRIGNDLHTWLWWYLVILGWDPHPQSQIILNHPQSPGLPFFSRLKPSPWNPGRPNRSHCSRVWRRKAWQSAPQLFRITVAMRIEICRTPCDPLWSPVIPAAPMGRDGHALSKCCSNSALNCSSEPPWKTLVTSETSWNLGETQWNHVARTKIWENHGTKRSSTEFLLCNSCIPYLPFWQPIAESNQLSQLWTCPLSKYVDLWDWCKQVKSWLQQAITIIMRICICIYIDTVPNNWFNKKYQEVTSLQLLMFSFAPLNLVLLVTSTVDSIAMWANQS